MPLPDQYFVARMKNVAADGGSEHFMAVQRSGYLSNQQAVEIMRHGYPHVEMSVDENAQVFGSKIEAEAEAWKMGAAAQAANPERIGAELQNPPGEINRILEAGKPGATPSTMAAPGSIADVG